MDFQDLCFAMQVIRVHSDDTIHLISCSDPNERASASHLRRHPYLELPDGWRFQGFKG
jgi:mitogen-activated protein kinase kinase kinase